MGGSRATLARITPFRFASDIAADRTSLPPCGRRHNWLSSPVNAAATVDWGPLGSAIGSGKAGPIAFAAGLAVYVVVMVAGIWISVAKARNAFRRRIAA